MPIPAHQAMRPEIAEFSRGIYTRLTDLISRTDHSNPLRQDLCEKLQALKADCAQLTDYAESSAVTDDNVYYTTVRDLSMRLAVHTFLVWQHLDTLLYLRTER